MLPTQKGTKVYFWAFGWPREFQKNPYLLGALPMTWFDCGPFARMVVAGVIYELRLVITRALAVADREDNKKYVEVVCDTYRHWPVRAALWALLMATFLLLFMYMAEVAVAQVIAHVVHNLEVVLALTTALKIPRKWSWTLKAVAIGLRGTLHSVTASAPLVAASAKNNVTPPTRHVSARWRGG